MPEDEDFTPHQWQRLARWLIHELSNVGMGMEGERREETQRGFWWLNDRRKAWDTDPERLDREWVRRSREAAGKKNDGARQIIVGICSAVGGALLLLLAAKLGLK